MIIRDSKERNLLSDMSYLCSEVTQTPALGEESKPPCVPKPFWMVLSKQNNTNQVSTQCVYFTRWRVRIENKNINIVGNGIERPRKGS